MTYGQEIELFVTFIIRPFKKVHDYSSFSSSKKLRHHSCLKVDEPLKRHGRFNMSVNTKPSTVSVLRLNKLNETKKRYCPPLQVIFLLLTGH